MPAQVVRRNSDSAYWALCQLCLLKEQQMQIDALSLHFHRCNAKALPFSMHYHFIIIINHMGVK